MRIRWLSFGVGGVFAFVWVLAWSEEFSQARERRDFFAALRDIRVVTPNDPPELSQSAIDTALVMFGIEVPATVEWPVYDERMRDRGLTIRAPGIQKSLVTVGAAAFESWALLGSTLAHEIEVHCQQNFPMISIMDLAGLEGTAIAERQAYLYELANARRFGLREMEQSLVEATMSYYYPEHNQSRVPWLESRGLVMPRFLRLWLAAQILPPAFVVPTESGPRMGTTGGPNS